MDLTWILSVLIGVMMILSASLLLFGLGILTGVDRSNHRLNIIANVITNQPINSLPINQSIDQPTNSSTEKRFTLTPSTFASAAGIHPFKSRQDLWRYRRGEKEEFSERQRAAMDHGIHNEQTALELYQFTVMSHNHSLVQSNVVRQHPEHVWFRGIPDGLVYQNDELKRVIEVKCPINDLPHQTLSQLYYYIPQIQGYMELFDVEEADIVSFTPQGTNIFRFRRDRIYWNLLLTALQDFWVYANQPMSDNAIPPPMKHIYTEDLIQRSKTMPWISPDLY